MISFSFPQWTFCVAQITLLGTVVLLIGRWLLNRRPDVVSLVSAIALLTGFALIIVTALDIPRLWSIPQLGEVQNARLAISNTEKSEQEESPNPNQQVASHPEQGITLHALLTKLRPWLYTPTSPQQRVGKAAFYIAIGLCAILFFRLVIGTLALTHLRLRSSALECNVVDFKLRSMADRIRVKRKLRVRVSQTLRSPCVNWLSPDTIFVPFGFESWTTEEQNASFAHELGHVKRCDSIWRMASEIAWVLNCWHPLMWMIRRQLTLAQELSADQLAVLALGNNKKYQKGLSLLALRLDSQANHSNRSVYFLGTSVSSSSLIRRIKMLKGFNTTQVNSSSGKRIFAICCSLVVSCWLCCWSVEAQTNQSSSQQTTQDQDQVCIAANTTIKPAKKMPFTRPMLKPWEKLSSAEGYICVRVAELLEHPIHSKTLPLAWDQMGLLMKNTGGTTKKLSEAGLPINIVSSVQATMQMHFGEIPEDQRDESGNTQRVTPILGANGVQVTTSEVVDWPTMVQSFDLSSMGSPEVCDSLRTQLNRNAAIGRKLTISGLAFIADRTKLAERKPAESLPRSIQNQMWNRVNGGVVTLISDTSGRVQSILAERGSETIDDEYEREAIATMKLVRGIAMGVDIGDANNEHVRIALEPVEGTTAEKLARNVKQALKLAADEAESADELHLAHSLRQLDVSVDSSEAGSFVVVSGELMLLYLISLFS